MFCWPFVEYWDNILYFNATFQKQLSSLHESCNYSSYIKQYFKFPPPTESFPDLSGPLITQDSTCDILSLACMGALESNPCFDVNHITQTCPFLYDPLSPITSFQNSARGTEVCSNRSDVKAAINARMASNWQRCSDVNVFGNGDNDNFTIGDTSLPAAKSQVLQRVIEHTNNTIIGVGNLDLVLPSNGTLFALQKVRKNFPTPSFANEADHHYLVEWEERLPIISAVEPLHCPLPYF
jgi:carboxypeptidase D